MVETLQDMRPLEEHWDAECVYFGSSRYRESRILRVLENADVRQVPVHAFVI